MEAIEFITKVKNGVIQIPKEYLDTLRNECRVIILTEIKSVSQKRTSPKKITSLKIKTKDLHFDRDEANER